MKRLQDFAVGDTFRAEREVDPYRSIYYAAASGDFNPIHVDPRVGRAAGFSGAILHGMCTYAWLAEACVEYLGDPARLRRLRVRFSRPLQVGDVVTFEGRCTAIEGATIRLEISATNQAGAEVLKGAAAEGRVEHRVCDAIPGHREAHDAVAEPGARGASSGGVPVGTPSSGATSPPGAGRQRAPEQAGDRVTGPRIDRKHLGRRYGPYVYAPGREDIRDFTAAVAGGVPGHVLSAPPDHAHPLTWDEEAAAAGPHGGVVAPPGFAAVYAIEPFARAVVDPALGIDVVRLLHGEQELEWLEPVRPGDVLTTAGEITRIEAKGGLDVLEVTTTSSNQHGRTVLRGVWTAVIRPTSS